MPNHIKGRMRERERGNMIGRTGRRVRSIGVEKGNMYWKSIRLLVCPHDFMVTGSLSLPSTEFPYIDGLMRGAALPPLALFVRVG